MGDEEQVIWTAYEELMSTVPKKPKEASSPEKKDSEKEPNYDDYPPPELPPNYSPRTIIKKLGRQVFGQQSAKETLALAMQGIRHRMRFEDEDLTKSNVLLMGPTGCGKTLLVDALGGLSRVPVVKLKMTGLSSEGYIGSSISQIFSQLSSIEEYSEGVVNVDFAIIYLDEIDKIAIRKNNDIFERGLQNELIGYLEDMTHEFTQISTSNLLFIGTGAFSGLEKIIEKRIGGVRTIGFQKGDEKSAPENPLDYVIPQDLIEYGFLPEFVGRFTNVGALQPLTPKDLIRILDMDTSYLAEKRAILRATNQTKLRLPQEAKAEIARYAHSQGTYARGLQGAVDTILRPLFLDLPEFKGKTIYISPETVKERLSTA